MGEMSPPPMSHASEMAAWRRGVIDGELHMARLVLTAMLCRLNLPDDERDWFIDGILYEARIALEKKLPDQLEKGGEQNADDPRIAAR